MKKGLLVVLTLLIIFIVVSCGGLPGIVRNARRNAPEDVLIGVGSARMPTQNESKIMAETRARAEIARAISSVVENMVRDYQAGSELDHSEALAFQEDITVALASSTLQGAVIVDEDWINGTYYVVMHMSKSDAFREINQSSAAAKLDAVSRASLLAEGRMNTAFMQSSAKMAGGLLYEIIGGRSITITGYTGNAAVLDIPAQIQSLPVTAIGYVAFWGCTSLTSITIPSSVTVIGDSAFLRCSSLTSITIPSSVMVIDASAFWDCSSLTSITISSSVTVIGHHPFVGCVSLVSITVDSPNPAYTSVDGILFDKNIQTIITYPAGKTARTYTVPSSVTGIHDGAFYHCSSLTSIIIPSSVTAIGDYTFGYCTSLTSITIPSSVTSIGDYAFRDCDSLTTVTLSQRTQVGQNAFPATAQRIFRD
jgi:hypothetical protein